MESRNDLRLQILRRIAEKQKDVVANVGPTGQLPGEMKKYCFEGTAQQTQGAAMAVIVKSRT